MDLDFNMNSYHIDLILKCQTPNFSLVWSLSDVRLFKFSFDASKNCYCHFFAAAVAIYSSP